MYVFNFNKYKIITTQKKHAQPSIISLTQGHIMVGILKGNCYSEQ